jgi:hypothetical protein
MAKGAGEPAGKVVKDIRATSFVVPAALARPRGEHPRAGGDLRHLPFGEPPRAAGPVRGSPGAWAENSA